MSGLHEDGRPPLNPSAGLGPVREAFDRAGYTEPAVLQRLGVAELPLFRQLLPALPYHLWHTRAGRPLDVLVRLFLLRQTVPAEVATAAVAPVPLEDWANAGLLHVGPTEVRAAVEVTPYQGLLVAADWPGPPGAEPVMGVAASSRALAQVTIRRPAAQALDLGTGCGVQALLAARHCGRVWAVDLNPRAVQAARFNAQLNGLAEPECLQGDLFEPVRGESFDLIVCNPPFVIGPGGGWLHTHGGRPVDRLCRDIVQGAAGLLREGGYCQLVCNWAHRAGQDWAERLAGWFDGTGCDAWVLRAHTEDAATYALNRIRERAGCPEEAAHRFDEWMAYYERERVEAVGFGVVTMRRSEARPNWFEWGPLPALAGPCGEAIAQRFERSDFLRKYQDDRDLLACRLRPADNLRWELRHELSAGGWAAVESRLSVKDGLTVGGNADRDVVKFVAACSADQPLGDHLRKVAAAAGQEVSRLAPGFLKVVRRLVELGYLYPVDRDG